MAAATSECGRESHQIVRFSGQRRVIAGRRVGGGHGNPGGRVLPLTSRRGCSSAGRAPPWHGGGRGSSPLAPLLHVAARGPPPADQATTGPRPLRTARGDNQRRDVPHLRQRSPQSGHRLDRLGDRLRRTAQPARPRQRVRARPAGDCNAQTTWLLERSGAAEPIFLPHVMPRARDVMQTSFPVSGQDEPIREAGLAMAKADLELVPIVDDRRGTVRRPDRTRPGPPLHPRDTAHLHPRGGAHLHQRDRRRARGRAA